MDFLQKLLYQMQLRRLLMGQFDPNANPQFQSQPLEPPDWYYRNIADKRAEGFTRHQKSEFDSIQVLHPLLTDAILRKMYMSRQN